MTELGETTDPAALVPGDPDSIENKAVELRRQGEHFGVAKEDLGRVDTGNWWGQASEAFWAGWTKEPPKWKAVCDSLDTTSVALNEYARVLRWAQGQASEAIALWEKGTAVAGAAMTDHRGASPRMPFTDPGAEYRKQADATLAAARQELDSAGMRSAAAIRGESGRPGALDRLVNEITGGWTATGSSGVTGPDAGVSASAPKGEKLGELKAFAQLVKASAQGSAGNEYVQLSGKAAATVAAEASLAGAVTNEGVGGKAEVMAGLKASAQGKVEFGPYAGYNGKVEYFRGAKATASGSVGLDGLNANVEAFAGQKVTAKVGGDIGGIGINTTAEGWVGAGAEAGVNFGPDANGTWHIGAHAGVAPGYGGKLGFELTIDPDDVAATATDAAQFVGNAAASTGEAIGDATSSAYDTVTFWN